MSQLTHISTFRNARVNLDKRARDLAPNEFREIHNLWAGVVGGDKGGAAEAMLGNLLVQNLPHPPAGINRCIGTAADTKNNAIIYFVYNYPETGDPQHGICRFNLASNTVDTILVDECLNFQLNHRITSAFVIGDLLYWTDGYEDADNPFRSGNYNPPRKINLRRAINLRLKEYSSVTLYSGEITYLAGMYVIYRKNIFKCVFPTVTNHTPPPTQTSNTWWRFIEEYIVDDNYLEINSRVIERILYPPDYEPSMLYGVVTLNGNRVNFENGIGSDPSTNSNNIYRKLFQFRYRYVYCDNEKSTFSSISKMPMLNGNEMSNGQLVDDKTTNNVICISINTGPFDVKEIEVAVREGNYGTWKIFERIYKYDENGTAVQEYPSDEDINVFFYNNTEGEAIDQDDCNRPFDYVPQISISEELIKDNRIVDANYVEGYDNTKIDVSLSPMYIPRDLSAGFVDFYNAVYSGGVYTNYRQVTPDGVYAGNVYSLYLYESTKSEPYGTTAGQSLTVVSYVAKEGDTLNDILEAIQFKVLYQTPWECYILNNSWLINFMRIESGTGTTYYLNFADGDRTSPISSFPSFKYGAWHKFGIVYYDRAGRHGAVNVSDESKIFIEDLVTLRRNGDIPDNEPYHQSILNWQINHQPPEWATHYQWVRAKSDIGWFLEFAITGDDVSIGATNTSIAFNHNIEAMQDVFKNTTIPFYEFKPGDRIRFIAKKYGDGSYHYFTEQLDFELLGNTYPDDGGYKKDDENAPIVDEWGNKVRDEAQISLTLPDVNLASHFSLNSSQQVIVQIYRVRKDITDEENELYFEFGEKFRITNPHTARRYHGEGYGISQDQTATKPAKGQFLRGDVYVKSRHSGELLFPCESMSFSDYYDSAFSDIGRPILIDRNHKRQWFVANCRYSGRYIQDTQVNDLSKIKYNDFVALDEKFGEITTLKDNANTLKVRQERKCTNIYLGRSALRQAEENGQDVVAVSDKVLGYQYQSHSIYGCADAEHNVYTGTYSYFVDVYNGVIVRDAPNGLQNISRYGVAKWVMDKCKWLLGYCTEYRIQALYDPEHEVVIFVFAGNIPTDAMPDNWLTEAIMFTEKDNKWVGSMDLKTPSGSPADCFSTLGDILVGWYEGKPYVFNTNPVRCNFFGEQYYPRVKFVANNQPGLIKVFNAISVHSNKVWEAPDTGDIWIEPTVNYPFGMSSRLKKNLFRSKEGIHHAAFRKNMLNNLGVEDTRLLYNGHHLRGDTMEISLTNTDDTDELVLNEIIVSSTTPKKVKNG